MSTHSRLWLLVPVTAVLVALSGCTPSAPTPTSSPSAGGSSSAPSSAPSATPTPTATTVSAPTTRAQLKCASLFALPNVATWTADTHAALKVDETTAPSDIAKVAALQLGTLSCVWGGKYDTDGGYDDALYVSIATDALDAFDANPLDNDSPVTNYSAGTKSSFTCLDQSGQFQCTADLLVGTTWASIFLQNEDGSTVTKPLLVSRIKAILDSLAGQIAGAPASAPAWVAPASASPSFCISSDATTVVRSVFGNPALKPSPDTGGGASDAQYGPTEKYIGDCTWIHGTHDDQVVEIQSLQGGAWALPVIIAGKPRPDYASDPLTAVTVTGADSAALACSGEDNSCTAMLAVKGNLYEVDFPDKGTATNLARLAALVGHFN